MEMKPVCFTPREMIKVLNQFAQEASALQDSAQKNRWCGGNLKRDFSILKASLDEKEGLLKETERRWSAETHCKMSDAAKKARQALDRVQATIDKQQGQSDFVIRFWKKIASLGSAIRGKPGLTSEQAALVEQFIQTEKSDWELNQKIVGDIEIVRELIRRNAFIRREGDSETSLLIATTSIYDPMEAFYYEEMKKNKDTPRFLYFAGKMKTKLQILDLLLKTKKWTAEDGFHFFKSCLIKDCSVFLDSVIQHKNLGIADPEKQLALWLSVSSLKGAQFLQKIGSDPNIRVQKGRTPLIELAARSYSYPLAAAPLANILIEVGADPKAVVEMNGISKSAIDLTADPYLKAVLLSSQK